jgi:hypothetical protein
MLILPFISTETELLYNEMITAVEPFLARGWCDWVTQGVKSLSVALRARAYKFKKIQATRRPLPNCYKAFSPPPFLLRLDGGQGGRQHKQLGRRHWVYDKAFPKKNSAQPIWLDAIGFS